MMKYSLSDDLTAIQVLEICDENVHNISDMIEFLKEYYYSVSHLLTKEEALENIEFGLRYFRDSLVQPARLYYLYELAKFFV